MLQKFLSEKQIIQLSLVLKEQLEKVLEHLGVEFEERDGNIYGCCPIHNGSDNINALQIYRNDYGIRWKCVTHGCENDYTDNGFGLISGILSTIKKESIPKWKAVKFCDDFFKTNSSTIDDVLQEDHEKREFILLSEIPTISTSTNSSHTTRNMIRNKLQNTTNI